MRVLTITNEKDEQFLRTKTVPFDFSKHSLKDINTLLKDMKQTMIDHDGIGLSANQVGLNFQLFVTQVPSSNSHGKFYALFNPQIIKTPEDAELNTEGCLSIPNTSVTIPRYSKITISAQDKNGKPVKVKVFGLLAYAFQHEIDHLNGILITDKATDIKTIK